MNRFPHTPTLKRSQPPTWRQLHLDTSPEVEVRLFQAWYTLPGWRKFALLGALNRTALELALSGTLEQYPTASTVEIRTHLVERLWGLEWAACFTRFHKKPGGFLIPERYPMSDSIFDTTLEVTRVLEALEIPYVIGGSLASTLYGPVRATFDADLLVDLSLEMADAFVAGLPDEMMIEPEVVYEAIGHRSSFSLLDQRTLYKVDLFIKKARAFDDVQLSRRRRQVIRQEPTEAHAYFNSPEDIILLKLEWYELGNRVSERQWRDVLGILKTRGHDLDQAYLHHWAEALGVTEALTLALAEVDS